MMARVILAVCLGWLATAAQAHVKSESHSVWRVDGAHVDLDYSVPLTETLRLATSAGTQPSDDRLLEYFKVHLSVSAKGGECRLTHGRAVRATDQFRRFEFAYQCPSAEGIALHSSTFFDLIASHVNLAQIETADGKFIEQIFNQDTQTLKVNTEGESLENAGFLQYVQMGIMHIFTGVDHMSFLVGLVLISRRTRDLIFVITGFTLGHSATLALAVTGILRPHAEYIDALVALTIALIGAENIAVATRRPGAVAMEHRRSADRHDRRETLGLRNAAHVIADRGRLVHRQLSDDLRPLARRRPLATGHHGGLRSGAWIWLRRGIAGVQNAGGAARRAAVGVQIWAWKSANSRWCSCFWVWLPFCVA